MLKLKPSERLKKRYLLIDAKDKETIKRVILDYIGILGYAKSAVFFVEDHKMTGKIILSIERKSLDDVRASFEMSKENIRVLRVSGTLKGLTK